MIVCFFTPFDCYGKFFSLIFGLWKLNFPLFLMQFFVLKNSILRLLGKVEKNLSNKEKEIIIYK